MKTNRANVIVKIVKKASEIYKSVAVKSRAAWHAAMREAAKLLKNNNYIQEVKLKLTTYINTLPDVKKKAVLSCVEAIGRDALALGNKFVADVANSVCRYCKGYNPISEKQAYVIARFYVEAKLNYGAQGFFTLPIID